MKPYFANLINSLVLILLGLWSYFGSETPSFTALIPVFAGIVLLAFTSSMKNGNRVAAHVVVTLTFLLLISLYKPLSGAINRGSDIAIIRVSTMMAFSLLAMVVYVKSFIDARLKK